jgi:hypothetical protein
MLHVHPTPSQPATLHHTNDTPCCVTGQRENRLRPGMGNIGGTRNYGNYCYMTHIRIGRLAGGRELDGAGWLSVTVNWETKPVRKSDTSNLKLLIMHLFLYHS